MSTGITANTDGSVTVEIDLNESGSQLADAKIVAVREDTAGMIRQDNVILSTTSGQAVVVRTPSLTIGNGLTITPFEQGSLEYYKKYHFYLACVDNQGWYNSPPGSSTALNTPGNVVGIPIQNNGGLVFDPSPPTMNITDVRPLADGTVRVRYTLGETGKSQIYRAKIVASTLDSISRDSVLDSDTSSDDVADVAVLQTDNVNVADGEVIFAGLTNWQPYKIYYSVKDNQGWYENGDLYTSGDANYMPINGNGGRTWDTVAPVITYNTQWWDNPNNSNRLWVRVNVIDNGNSGIYKATIYLRQSGSDDSISQSTVLDGSGTGIRKDVLSDTNSNYNNTIDTFFDLDEYTEYRIYVAIRDKQGNYDGSLAQADGDYNPVQNPRNVTSAANLIGNGIEAGRSHDLTRPTLEIKDAQAQPDGSVIVWYDMTEGGGSGVADNGAKMLITSDIADMAPSNVLISDSTYTQDLQEGLNQKVIFTESQVQEFSELYFFGAVLDNQGWYSSSVNYTDPGVVSAYQIQNNDNKTWDKSSVPSIDADPLLSFIGATEVKITWQNAHEGVSGIKHVKLLVTNETRNFTAYEIANAENSATQRVTLIPAEENAYAYWSSNANVSGLNSGDRVYGWVLVVNNMYDMTYVDEYQVTQINKNGNFSAPTRTSPTFVDLDSTRPTISFVSGSQTSTEISVNLKVNETLTGFWKYDYLFSANANQNPLNQNTTVMNLAQVPENEYPLNFVFNKNTYGIQQGRTYYLTVHAYDGAENRTLNYFSQTIDAWDTTSPTFNSAPSTYSVSGTSAYVNYNVSDVGRGLRSLVGKIGGTVKGTKSFGTSVNTSSGHDLRLTNLSYGNNSISYTLTDRANDGGNQFDRLNDRTATTSGTITVPYPSPSVSSLQNSTSGLSTTDRMTKIKVTWSASSVGGSVYITSKQGSAPTQSEILNGTNLGSGANTRTFTGLSNGTTYYIGVAATNGDNVKTHSTVSITTLQQPSITFSEVTSERIEQLTYKWTVNDENLNKVEFYYGSTLAGSSTSYSNTSTGFTKTGISEGSYTWKIKATDNSGLTHEVTGGPVTVDGPRNLTWRPDTRANMTDVQGNFVEADDGEGNLSGLQIGNWRYVHGALNYSYNNGLDVYLPPYQYQYLSFTQTITNHEYRSIFIDCDGASARIALKISFLDDGNGNEFELFIDGIENYVIEGNYRYNTNTSDYFWGTPGDTTNSNRLPMQSGLTKLLVVNSNGKIYFWEGSTFRKPEVRNFPYAPSYFKSNSGKIRIQYAGRKIRQVIFTNDLLSLSDSYNPSLITN